MSYQIDPAHTLIQFSVRHMMLAKVRGVFEKFTGTVTLDVDHPEKTAVDISVETSSINTRESNRDNHLRSPDFFDVEKFPVMRFRSTKVEVLSKQSAKLHGDLTIRDITRTVVLDVEYAGSAKSPWGTTSHGFSAVGKLARKDWNLTWNQVLETGGVLVGEEVELFIELELVQGS